MIARDRDPSLVTKQPTTTRSSNRSPTQPLIAMATVATAATASTAATKATHSYKRAQPSRKRKPITSNAVELH
jgi:hypothetical protein